MSSPDENAKTVKRYLEYAAQGRVDEIVALYADDATVEDPVGSEAHIGHKAIHGFYSQVPDAGNETELFTLRALGQEVAFRWALTIALGDNRSRIDIISVMTFTDEGKIASMKAYWTPDDMKQL